ncbi:MAG: DUF255 domain-containing protein [Methylococcaceae bacterium]|nr:MAG: DUF255 domain-containing protein [Methylococcaceae bacterium]
MKTLVLICMAWMLSIAGAFADIPKADLSILTANLGQWPAKFSISMVVPRDHHAYLDRGEESSYIPITFDADANLAKSGLAISKLDKPAGVYDSLAKATVLRDSGEFTVWLTHDADAQPWPAAQVPLAVKYQLCNDVTHVCFRPQTAHVELAFPVGTATNSQTTHQTESAGIMDSLLELFNSHRDNAWLTIGLMFIAGLLSVATPCVYPMLPITAVYMVNRAHGDPVKERQHALVYVIGIIGTYVALGIVAGMTGGAFSALMHSAWVNLVFALFFAFFALSLLGFYDLSFLQDEVHVLDRRAGAVKGFAGTWLMGSVAGLVISPCVGPIVFALLLHVADDIAAKAAALSSLNQTLSFTDRFMIALQGGPMMAGFGAGISLPFFVAATVKFKSLPKSGFWMNKIKHGFGIIILYFAYVYLDKGIGILGAKTITSLSLALGLLMVWTAVVYFNVFTSLPEDARPHRKMLHFCGVMSLITGAWLVVTAFGSISSISTAQAASMTSCTADGLSGTGKTSDVEEEAGILWQRRFENARQLAQQTGKPIFVDFYASWCANCTAFKEETATNAALNRALREKAVPLRLVDNEPDFERFRADAEHRQLKIGLPYFAILSPTGKLIWSGADYKATEKMIAVLNRFSG